ARFLGREDAVGADHLVRDLVANEKVLAERIENIAVNARRSDIEPRSHFLCEDPVPQFLRFQNFRHGSGEVQ
ncbi:MAG TPA: hypothetical protein PLK99_08875, partial [Burkholderiales bacterium]|nr:hypothetical protein [Burkholderiales bacterium]